MNFCLSRIRDREKKERHTRKHDSRTPVQQDHEASILKFGSDITVGASPGDILHPANPSFVLAMGKTSRWIRSSTMGSHYPYLPCSIGLEAHFASSIGRPSHSAPPCAGATQTMRFFCFLPAARGNSGPSTNPARNHCRLPWAVRLYTHVLLPCWKCRHAGNSFERPNTRPPPQDTEHASNSVQAPHSQSTGQG